MKTRTRKPSFVLLFVFLLFAVAIGSVRQAGKGSGGRRIVTLNVIVRAPEGRQVTKQDFDLYDSGVAQEVENFSRMDSGSRIVLMVDDSSSLRAE
ncbi:MAG TPA: hypothetical protein VLU47_06465, partial [Blastocatellia bacterium]|nr:hypothetical protein [Blastocatellia bacterium]